MIRALLPRFQAQMVKLSAQVRGCVATGRSDSVRYLVFWRHVQTILYARIVRYTSLIYVTKSSVQSHKTANNLAINYYG